MMQSDKLEAAISWAESAIEYRFDAWCWTHQPVMSAGHLATMLEALSRPAAVRDEVVEDASERTLILEWWAAPRPPVHPERMKGRQGFVSLEKAVAFMRRQAPDSEFISLTEHATFKIDRSAALASQPSATDHIGDADKMIPTAFVMVPREPTENDLAIAREAVRLGKGYAREVDKRQTSVEVYGQYVALEALRIAASPPAPSLPDREAIEMAGYAEFVDEKPEPLNVGEVLAVLGTCINALQKQHNWHAAQTDPDPEHGYIPADEYDDSALHDETHDAIVAARTLADRIKGEGK